MPILNNGSSNELCSIAPEQLAEIDQRALETGIQLHTHTNGDQATPLTLVDVHVLDHAVISLGAQTSMAERGLL